MERAYAETAARNQIAGSTISPDTALTCALRGFRQRAESAVDRLERINERFSQSPPRPASTSGLNAAVERVPSHSDQIDRIEALLTAIHSQIDTLDGRV